MLGTIPPALQMLTALSRIDFCKLMMKCLERLSDALFRLFLTLCFALVTDRNNIRGSLPSELATLTELARVDICK